MGFILAFVFLAIAIGGLVLYGGTPHGGPTSVCGPIDVLGHTYTVTTDCRYVSAAEVAVIVAFLLLAVVSVLVSRPGRRAG